MWSPRFLRKELMGIPEVEHRLSLIGEAPALAVFTPMLMEGVELEAELGCSVREFLCDRIGLDGGYVDERIQTVFLDGKPVDRLDRAAVRNGSVLALSAALPGLLGATLRKDGAYASLRRGITHEEPGGACETGRGLVTIKVFNVLLGELAPVIFQSGIHVDWKRLETRIKKGKGRLMEAVRAAEIDGRPVSPEEAASPAWRPESRVLFSFSVD